MSDDPFATLQFRSSLLHAIARGVLIGMLLLGAFAILVWAWPRHGELGSPKPDMELRYDRAGVTECFCKCPCDEP